MARLALFASLVGAGAGCGDEGPKSPIAPYLLTTIGTAQLPVVMYEAEGYRLEVTAGTLELVAPGTYEITLTEIETVDGNKSTYVERETGTWILGDGGAITFTAATGETFSGAWKRTALTVTREDETFAFEMTDR